MSYQFYNHWNFNFCHKNFKFLDSRPKTRIIKNVVEKQRFAEIAQLVEHTTENCSVHSSILCLGTKSGITFRIFCFYSLNARRPVRDAAVKSYVPDICRRQELYAGEPKLNHGKGYLAEGDAVPLRNDLSLD